MSYEDIRIEGSLTEAMEAWVARRYGKVVDIEMTGINEGDFAAVGYAAVENAEAGTVEAVVLMLQHDPEAGPDRYRLKDMAEEEGPVLDFCPERILDLLSPTDDVLASHWRERCRDQAAEVTRNSAFALNS
ncbi:hypothetical protein AB8A20_11660 [Tardiphaga sp. 604_B6_N1_1]|jgi:hypothetical protein|uniref:hypothetical protein n=1 Tax=unclassified Tardiphaga TaxID=2631404 RepID=UPI003F2488A5